MMRRFLLAAAFGIPCCALVSAAPAIAQECFFPPVALPGAGDPVPPPFSSGIFVASPPDGTLDAPLNVELRLSGTTAELDTNPPNFTVELLDDGGARVPLTRQGGVARAAFSLRPRATYTVRVSPTDANPCGGCFIPHEISFETGVEEDHEAPVLEVSPPTFVFALPSQAEMQRCGVFTQETHSIVVDFDTSLPRGLWISVAAKHERADPVFAAERFYNGGSFSLVTSAGQVPVALSDVISVAFTVRDLAGNVAPARVVRTRARSFQDAAIPREEMSDLTCDVAPGLVVHAANPLPENGHVQVDFPFEEQPVSLLGGDGSIVALFPVEETARGHVFAPASPLSPNEDYEVVTRSCPHCVCAGCAFEAPVPVSVGSGVDNVAPAEPDFVELREDANPIPSRETCRADRPALVVILNEGKDDTTAPLGMRYRATVKIEDGLTYELGSGHKPVSRGDGTVALRIETPGLPRLLGERLTLTLDAEDAAGNTTRGVLAYSPDEPEASGCAGAGASGLLALGALLRRRRRLTPAA